MTGMALQKLIEETLDRNRWSAAEVARRATARGHKLTDSDLSNYKNPAIGMSTIVPQKINALAAGLELPAHVIIRAVMADHGVHWSESLTTPEQAIQADHTLPVLTKQSLLAILGQAR